MKTCKTCKHWAEVPDQYYRGFDRVCESEKLHEEAPRNGETDHLCYPYSEGGGFFPGPDFGCVHHEEAFLGETGIGPDCKICGFNQWIIHRDYKSVECENCGQLEDAD